MIFGKDMLQQAPRAFTIDFNTDLIKKCKGIGPGSSRSILCRFRIRVDNGTRRNWVRNLQEHVLLTLEKDFDKKYPRNLLEYFPWISSKDSIMELEGIDPRSSKRIFH